MEVEVGSGVDDVSGRWSVEEAVSVMKRRERGMRSKRSGRSF